jgi:phosphoglycolate phosphatase
MTWLAFDMDGTLYDCGDIVATAFRRGIETFIAESEKDLKIPTKEEILNLVGMPTSEIFTSLFKGLSAKEYDNVNDLCLFSLVEDVKKKKGYIYEGIIETVKFLKKNNYKLVIASNGRIEYLEAILTTYQIAQYFESEIFVLGGQIITKNDIVAKYIEKKPADDLLIMIGDRASDQNAAQVNEVPFIGCSFGHACDEIISAKWIAKSIVEIPKIVKEIEMLERK